MSEAATTRTTLARHQRVGGPPAVGWKFLFDGAIVLLGTWLLISSVLDLIEQQPAKSYAAVLLLLNGVMAGIGFMVALYRERPLFLVIFFFNFIFFSIGPANQIAILEDPIYNDDQLVQLAIELCTAFIVICLLFVLFGKTRGSRAGLSQAPSIYDGDFQPQLLCAASLILSFCLLAFYWPVLLQTREALDSYLQQSFDKTIVVIFLSFLNPLSFVTACVGWAAAYRRRSFGWMVLFAFCLIPAVLVNNPINFARFRVSTLIVFAALLHFGVRRVRLLAVLLILGTSLSGYLNIFRFNMIYLDAAAQQLGTFSTMDFHILNLICYAIKYTDQTGFSYGSNVLSAVLFFVPRAIWESKTDYISYYFFDLLSQYRYYGTNNLSSPIVAEGYFAFGVPGAILLSVAVLWVISNIERRGLSAREGSLWHLFLCISPMLTLILMRGAFIVGCSEICGHFAAVLISFLLLGVPRNAVRAARTPSLAINR